jgi:peptidoglycan/xylan/chitin deacetylase (PgdA/CDA1 family)
MSITRKQRLAASMVTTASSLRFFDAYSFLRGHLVKSEVIIFVYHRVDSIKYPWGLPAVMPLDFENQIRYLCETRDMLTLDELVQCIRNRKPLPKRAAVITFDDGYKDVYAYAYPILKKYNVPAIVFLTTGHIGTRNLFWFDKVRYALQNTPLKTLKLDGIGNIALGQTNDRLQAFSTVVEQLKNLSEEKKDGLIEELIRVSGVDIPADLGKEIILSWHDVIEMSNNGIDFGAHTVTHPILAKVSRDRATYEIRQSKKEIEERLGKPVTAFSYPQGNLNDFNNEIVDLVKESGFTCAVTTMPKMVTQKADLYELGRIPPGQDYSRFKLFASGSYSDMKGIVRRTKGRNE